ncbi:MAG: SPOR domain-containing protein [Spirochaetaceae bacterium]
MEQQKVLIIIISAALFIAAVLGVGLALFYPDGERGEVAASAQEFDPIEYARPPEAEEEEPREEESVIVYGGDEEDTSPKERVILLTEELAEEHEREQEREQESEKESSEPDTAVTSRRAREPATPRETAPEPDRVDEPVPTERPEPRESATEASYRTDPEREPRRIRVTEHWIQLISSPAKERVDLVREQLREEYSLGARVTTKEVDDRTYYRLRLGPYDDRGEAEKFLSWIREIDGFGEAYISEEYPLRTVR